MITAIDRNQSRIQLQLQLQDLAIPMASSGAGMSMTTRSGQARSNNHTTRAATDLVSSLAQPSSHDHIARSFESLAASESISNRGRTAPSTMSTRSNHPRNDTSRRSGPLLAPHPSSLDVPKRYGGNAIFDLYCLNYKSETDPNLLCPICQDPMVDPVTTPCDHTFCYRCIRRSIASSPSGTACPIDRESLVWKDCFSAGRLIRVQLNNLMVACPFSARGCDMEMRREAVEQHAKHECKFREYACPGRDCEKIIRYQPTDDRCRHQQDECTYCFASIEDAEREFHLLSCPSSKTRCESCWKLIVRNQMAKHHEFDCDGVEVTCPYREIGCPVHVMRGHLGSHILACAFHPDTPSGAIIRSQQKLIQSHGDLGSQLRDIYTRQDEANRRLDDIVALLAAPSGGPDSVSFRDKRGMSEFDAGFEEINQNLTQLEARQSLWTLNQVMPIREEVTELRNGVNMIRMHINWLSNRYREGGRSWATNSPGAAATSTRILSENSRHPRRTGLSERRHSSDLEYDTPRL